MHQNQGSTEGGLGLPERQGAIVEQHARRGVGLPWELLSQCVLLVR